jgi:hypothetical protein
MASIIGERVPIQQLGTPRPNLDLGDAFSALAKPFMDTLKPELTRQQIAKLAQGTGGRSTLSGLLRAGVTNPDELNGAAVLANVNPRDLAGYGQFRDATKYGPASAEALRATMAVPGANYGSTIQGVREHENTQREMQRMQERTKFALAGQTPTNVIDEASGAPVIVRRDQAYGRTPVVPLTDTQSVLLRNNFNKLGTGAINPAQERAMGAQPHEQPPLNWVERRADGTTAQGRSLDGGRTDASTGRPLSELAPNAQLVSAGNAGGTGVFAPAGATSNPVNDKLTLARDAHRQVVDLATRLKSMVQSDPSIVGPAGNVQRGVQYAFDTGSGVARLFGSQAEFEKQFNQARDDLAAKGVTNVPGIVFDPKASAVAKLNTILVYKAASALAGQSGRELSDKDVQHATSFVGDPTSWFEGPQRYLAGLDAAINESGRGLDAIGAQLKARNISPQNGMPGAASRANFQEGATATNPMTGEKIIFRGGAWVPQDGGAIEKWERGPDGVPRRVQ